MAQQTTYTSNSFVNMTEFFEIGDEVSALLHANYGETGKGYRGGFVTYVSPYFVTVDFDCFKECFNSMEWKEGKLRKVVK
ncbi:MAG: hypothetical protein K5656_04330 [Lachnospiraceae bacterium]|nr:hypothetical protein [Lachnospiraceae bacterium]